jgi:beta-galactosidase
VAPAAAAGIRLNRSAEEGGAIGRRVVNFNGGWKFSRGQQSGASAVDYDDTRWEPVRLPHDWAIAGPFNPRENGYAGKLPWRGVGWYRKTFTLDRTDAGRRVYLDFDGVMAFPRVYVNGQLAGEWDYGYMSFRVDATKSVKFGGRNVIAVLVDTSRHGTRWYPGAGIYRNVAMTICEPVHLAHWGTFVTTPEVSDSSARVRIQTGIRNFLQEDAALSIEVAILDSDSKSVARGKRDLTVQAGGSAETELSLPVANPRRWDLESPRRYTARALWTRRRFVLESGRSSSPRTTASI